MPETPIAAGAGDTPQDWTPEQAAPVFASILFPEATTAPDTIETREPAPDADETPAPEAPDAEPEATEEVEPETAAEESENAPEAPAEPPQPRTLRVKLPDSDAEVEVTEEELVKGYTRHADYTRKTMALAEERKAFEAEQAAVRAERQRYAELLQQLEAALQPPEPPDWVKLKAELPPEQFAAQWAEWEMQERQRATVRAEREAAERQLAAERATLLQQQLAEERRKLLEAIPEWRDEAAYREGATALAQYLTESYGFTPQEIAATTRHELLVLARKAMMYDTMQKNKPKLEQQAASKIKPATPGSATPKKRPSDAERAASRLARTGSVTDAAKLFEHIL